VNEVLDVVLVHQSDPEVQQLVDFWSNTIAPRHLLIAHGGTREAYESVRYAPKIFVEDSRLRTRDHQRELQSLTALFKDVRSAVHTAPRFVFFAEYDHLPLANDLHERLVETLTSEDADVLAFHLHRVDNTNHPHYLNHVAQPRFKEFLHEITIREKAGVVLSMLGTGSFWKWEAFYAVASVDEPFPMYSEIYLPTLAHHLGFRLRDCAAQNRFVSPRGDRSSELKLASAAGAWTLHPVKRIRELMVGADRLGF
jgi:hypothetical protein